MSASGNSTNTALIALLYHPTKSSNDSERHQLEHCFNSIQNDHVLKKMIYLLPIGSPNARNWIKHNKSGLSVTNYPCFVVRISTLSPKIYTLGDCNAVYNIAHHHHGQFSGMTSVPAGAHVSSQPGPGTSVPMVMSEDSGNSVLDNLTTGKMLCDSPSSSSSSSSVSTPVSSSGNPPVCEPFDEVDHKKKHHHRKPEVIEAIVFEKKDKSRKSKKSKRREKGGLEQLSEDLQSVI